MPAPGRASLRANLLRGDYPMMMMARAKEADSTPVSPGETTLSVSIEAVFELGR
ncbi:hypothetical protein [Pseudoxanthomonas sp. JBR18]|uniref:hypothetical protein n=1 Tax=Pseudoxanthomonas sp. JBR18 TaxID=2969308 RepID=UPI0023056E3E|nr:hypothetical protein [Pseudoxanthomonas sp. JBR18]WCE04294.1 hypothetical protein PJ250_19875 [Pseudoxanthomonas sp. JBR18]